MSFCDAEYMCQRMGLEAERYAENLLSLRGYCEIEGLKNSEGSQTVMTYIFEAVACSWFS